MTASNPVDSPVSENGAPLTPPAPVWRYYDSPSGVGIYVLIAGVMTIGFLVMAYWSFEPSFYAHSYSGRGAWLVVLMRSEPIWLRVATWVALAALPVFCAVKLVARFQSGKAALILSAEGLTGFELGGKGARRTIAWSNLSGFQKTNRERLLHISGVDRSRGSTPENVSLVVVPKMMDYTAEDLIKEINSYRELYLKQR